MGFLYFFLKKKKRFHQCYRWTLERLRTQEPKAAVGTELEANPALPEMLLQRHLLTKLNVVPGGEGNVKKFHRCDEKDKLGAQTVNP